MNATIVIGLHYASERNQTKVGLKLKGGMREVFGMARKKSDQGGIEMPLDKGYIYYEGRKKSDQGGIEIPPSLRPTSTKTGKEIRPRWD